jgi:hypothetical protein
MVAPQFSAMNDGNKPEHGNQGFEVPKGWGEARVSARQKNEFPEERLAGRKGLGIHAIKGL